jgi:hypothetical protein
LHLLPINPPFLEVLQLIGGRVEAFLQSGVLRVGLKAGLSDRNLVSELGFCGTTDLGLTDAELLVPLGEAPQFTEES